MGGIIRYETYVKCHARCNNPIEVEDCNKCHWNGKNGICNYDFIEELKYISHGVEYGNLVSSSESLKLKYKYYDEHPNIQYGSVKMSEIHAWKDRGYRDKKSYDEYGKFGEL